MKKTKKKSTTQPKTKTKKSKEVQKDSLLHPIASILCTGIGLFLLVHQFIDSQTGVIGLSIELATLYTFGTIGFQLLPILCILTGLSLIIRKKSITKTLSMISIAYLTLIELTFAITKSGLQATPLTQIGYIGQFLHHYTTLFFGHTGHIILCVTTLLISGSYLLNISWLSCLKPFLILKKIILSFSQTTLEEIEKVNPTKALKLKIIHTLFFSKNKSKHPPRPLQSFPSKQELLTPTPPTQTENFSFNLDEIKIKETNQDKEEILNDIIPTPPVVIDELPEKSEIKKETSSKTTTEDILQIIPSQSHDNYINPPINLLKEGKAIKHSIKTLTKKRVEKAAILEEALLSFNVKAKVVNITPGPSVTRFELQPGEGVKISKITALSKDIALKLAAPDVRIEAPIPGKSLVGIEVPNDDIQMITLRTIMESSNFMNLPSLLSCGMGKTITGESIIMDLAKMPHVLIAGATGSGKSVCINTIILSILMKATPEDVKMVMIDPKKVELSLYEGIPHLIAPVVTNPNKAAATLKQWALVEMENRYETFSKVGVKDITGYNNYVKKELEKNPDATHENLPHALEKLPYIVVIIDELADLMMVASQEVESTICRLAQMARATGIHLVIATQRPSVNVITGLIKANVPSRISFYLQSQIDSRTILDTGGAEKLLGKGDMLYSPVGSFKPTRVQGVFVSEQEVKSVVNWVKKQGQPAYLTELVDIEPLKEEKTKDSKNPDQDALFEDAKELIINSKYASTSFLQRKLRIGYNRAARIMDELEQQGIISEYVGDKKARSVG